MLVRVSIRCISALSIVTCAPFTASCGSQVDQSCNFSNRSVFDHQSQSLAPSQLDSPVNHSIRPLHPELLPATSTHRSLQLSISSSHTLCTLSDSIDIAIVSNLIQKSLSPRCGIDRPFSLGKFPLAYSTDLPILQELFSSCGRLASTLNLLWLSPSHRGVLSVADLSMNLRCRHRNYVPKQLD